VPYVEKQEPTGADVAAAAEGAGHKHVGAELERVARQVGMGAEVRRPRRVDQQRDLRVRDLRERSRMAPTVPT
jgi:hypothetical protein